MIKELLNQVIPGSNERPIVYDVVMPNKETVAPVLLFCHGYKGFKDWGAWHLMATTFAKAGVACVKFNYSHNGGTLQEPIDFPDLEAFGSNNYSYEVHDTKLMIDWISATHLPLDKSNIFLMGHSRAGGITTIVTASDERVKGLITLAGVTNYERRFPQGEDLIAWKEKGVMFVENGRTKQQMPLYYQFYEDFIANRDSLDILKAASSVQVPFLIIHGDDDNAVNVEEAFDLKEAAADAQLLIIREANHVFGAYHPYDKNQFPEAMQTVVQCSLNFIQNVLS
ncbi:MAG: alpha/beta hydrolase [Nonlabens sp.]|nr:alpha/beta hydrolase [Nonlabens sp.]